MLYMAKFPNKILRPSAVDRARIAADPLAALVGYVSTILAVFGVFEKTGLNGDEVAILGGAVLGVAATMRTMLERANRKNVEEMARENTELKARQAAHDASQTEGAIPKG